MIRGVGATKLIEQTKKKVKNRRTHIWALKMIAELVRIIVCIEKKKHRLLKAQQKKLQVNRYWEKEKHRRRLKKELTGDKRDERSTERPVGVQFSSSIVSQILIPFLAFNSIICFVFIYLFIADIYTYVTCKEFLF